LLAKAKGGLHKIAEVSFRTVLYSLDDVAKLLRLEAMPLGPGRIQEHGEQYEKENLQERLGTDGIQAHLDKAVSTVLDGLGAKNGKLVIFIDDLDRCTPECAFRLLEGLKIYLSLSRCVFVIGMNQQLVVDSIGSCIPMSSFPDEIPSKSAFAKMRAEAYLEKICSTVDRLVPVPDPLRIVREWVSIGELKESLMAYEASARTGLCFLPPNPRRIKAFVNELQRNYVIYCAKVNRGVDRRELLGLIAVSYVYQFHSELFQRWQFNADFFSYLKKWIVSSDPASGKEWPSYLTCLDLPVKYRKSEQTEAVVSYEVERSYPDPYASNVFWIASIVADSELTGKLAGEMMTVIYGRG